MLIREFDAADRSQVRLLLQQNTNMAEGELDQVLERGNRLVALRGGILRGFAWFTSGRPGVYSFSVFVDPAARRQGIGDSLWRQLLASLPGDAQQVFCGYTSTDSDAHAFLQARGFKPWYGLELMHYSGPAFPDPQLAARAYRDEDYEEWIRLQNDGFYPMRQAMDIKPYLLYPDEVKSDPATRQKALDSGDDDDLLFYDGQQLVGMAIMVKDEIETVTVASHLRRKGYGRRIIAYCTNRMLARGINPVTLHVVSWNTDARQLYESMGYRLVEKRDVLRLKLEVTQASIDEMSLSRRLSC